MGVGTENNISAAQRIVFLQDVLVRQQLIERTADTGGVHFQSNIFFDDPQQDFLNCPAMLRQIDHMPEFTADIAQRAGEVTENIYVHVGCLQNIPKILGEKIPNLVFRPVGKIYCRVGDTGVFLSHRMHGTENNIPVGESVYFFRLLGKPDPFPDLHAGEKAKLSRKLGTQTADILFPRNMTAALSMC